jgi:hypothetical protein
MGEPSLSLKRLYTLVFERPESVQDERCRKEESFFESVSFDRASVTVYEPLDRHLPRVAAGRPTHLAKAVKRKIA